MLTRRKVSDGGPQGSVSCPRQCFYPRLGTGHGAYIQQHIRELGGARSFNSLQTETSRASSPVWCWERTTNTGGTQCPDGLTTRGSWDWHGAGWPGLVCWRRNSKPASSHRTTTLTAQPLQHAGVWKGVGEQWQGRSRTALQAVGLLGRPPNAWRRSPQPPCASGHCARLRWGRKFAKRNEDHEGSEGVKHWRREQLPHESQRRQHRQG